MKTSLFPLFSWVKAISREELHMYKKASRFIVKPIVWKIATVVSVVNAILSYLMYMGSWVMIWVMWAVLSVIIGIFVSVKGDWLLNGSGKKGK